MVGSMAVVLIGVLAILPSPAWAIHRWSIVSSPDNETGNNGLSGVSCVSAMNCEAVGSSAGQTLVESWNGGAWTIQSSPDNGTENNVLAGVSCVSATSCEAVGYEYLENSADYFTLVESWNGTAWTIQSSQNAEPGQSLLSGVSCVSATSCEAVGDDVDTGGVSRSFVESWNGGAWTIQSSPDNGTEANVLSGVSCVSATSCQAVGSYESANGIHSLVESWNGAAWTIQSSPDNGTDADVLSGVSCVSATSCQAVGDRVNPSFISRTLVESKQHSKWKVHPSPNQGSQGDSLIGVSCVSTSCQAVGEYDSASGTRTLIESSG